MARHTAYERIGIQMFILTFHPQPISKQTRVGLFWQELTHAYAK